MNEIENLMLVKIIKAVIDVFRSIILIFALLKILKQYLSKPNV